MCVWTGPLSTVYMYLCYMLPIILCYTVPVFKDWLTSAPFAVMLKTLTNSKTVEGSTKESSAWKASSPGLSTIRNTSTDDVNPATIEERADLSVALCIATVNHYAIKHFPPSPIPIQNCHMAGFARMIFKCCQGDTVIVNIILYISPWDSQDGLWQY